MTPGRVRGACGRRLVLGSGELVVEVLPGWVLLFDEVEFPAAVPFFDLFFAADGVVDVVVGFEVDEGVDAVFVGEAGDQAGFVFFDSSAEVVGEADVEGSISSAGEDVDEVGVHGLW